MISKHAPCADDPVRPRTVPIDDTSLRALTMLRQAYAYAEDAGADLWDFALEIGRLFDTRLTISALRWLVAKGFAEHGQESSAYGSPHRSFRRGEGYFFDHSTCVVLTPSGAAFVDRFLNRPDGCGQSPQTIETAPLAEGATIPLRNGSQADNHRKGTTLVADVPCWNEARRELTLKGKIVKRFRVPAPNQVLILCAFEEEGWPDHIDDPLPVSGDIDPPTRLHDAINRLNGRQTHRLLRFSGNGHGNGVCWEVRQAAGSRQTDSW